MRRRQRQMCIRDSGKKGIAEKILYDAFDIVQDKSKKDPIDIFKKALNNASPHVEVKSKRIGGATYQVPIEVPSRRQFYLASQWIIESAKKRSGSSMSNRLAGEILSASNNEGSAIKKKEDTHRMAEANKAFAHFCLLYTSPSPRDRIASRMPSSA